MTATLTVTEPDPLHRVYVLDCDHATTTVEYLVPSVGEGVSEETIISTLRSRHRASCSCGWVIVRGGGA
jgi:hypothetical protein